MSTEVSTGAQKSVPIVKLAGLVGQRLVRAGGDR